MFLRGAERKSLAQGHIDEGGGWTPDPLLERRTRRPLLPDSRLDAEERKWTFSEATPPRRSVRKAAVRSSCSSFFIPSAWEQPDASLKSRLPGNTTKTFTHETKTKVLITLPPPRVKVIIIIMCILMVTLTRVGGGVNCMEAVLMSCWWNLFQPSDGLGSTTCGNCSRITHRSPGSTCGTWTHRHNDANYNEGSGNNNNTCFYVKPSHANNIISVAPERQNSLDVKLKRRNAHRRRSESAHWNRFPTEPTQIG